MNDQWRIWFAEHLARGSAEEYLAQIMLNQNVPLGNILAEVKVVYTSPAYLAFRRMLRDQRKYAAVMRSVQLMWQQNPNYETIDVIDMPTRQEFYEKYWLPIRPVIIKDFTKNWDKTVWSFEYMRNNFDNLDVEVMGDRDSENDYELNMNNHKQPIKLHDLLDYIMTTEESNNLYITANNRLIEKLPELYKAIGPLPDFIKRPPNDGAGYLWVGAKGSYTTMHQDLMGLINVQIIGRKKWQIVSILDTPRVYNQTTIFSQLNTKEIDFNRFPLMQDVKIIEVFVNEGDAIFMPFCWWHTVEALDKSISLSFTGLDFPNSWEADLNT
jgi:ribosomal protein L16 Arg81 hydroxylase